jgi:hypothetical protein
LLLGFIGGANGGGLRGLVDVLVIVRGGARPGVVFEFLFLLLSDSFGLLRLLGLGFGVHHLLRTGEQCNLGEDLE